MHIFINQFQRLGRYPGYSNDPVMVDPVAYGFTDKKEKLFRKGELKELFERCFTDKKAGGSGR